MSTPTNPNNLPPLYTWQVLVYLSAKQYEFSYEIETDLPERGQTTNDPDPEAGRAAAIQCAIVVSLAMRYQEVRLIRLTKTADYGSLGYLWSATEWLGHARDGWLYDHKGAIVHQEYDANGVPVPEEFETFCVRQYGPAEKVTIYATGFTTPEAAEEAASKATVENLVPGVSFCAGLENDPQEGL